MLSMRKLLSKALNPNGNKDDIDKTEKFLEGKKVKEADVEQKVVVLANLIDFQSLKGFNKDGMTFPWGWNEYSTDIWPRQGCIILCKTRAVGDPDWMRGMLEPFKIISPDEWEEEIEKQITEVRKFYGDRVPECEVREQAKKKAINEINMRHHGVGQIIPLFVGPFEETD